MSLSSRRTKNYWCCGGWKQILVFAKKTSRQPTFTSSLTEYLSLWLKLWPFFRHIKSVWWKIPGWAEKVVLLMRHLKNRTHSRLLHEITSALCGYPIGKMEIRDSSQISTTAPIFQQYNYFRQNLEENVTFTFYFFSFASNFPCKILWDNKNIDANILIFQIPFSQCCWPRRKKLFWGFFLRCKHHCQNVIWNIKIFASISLLSHNILQGKFEVKLEK